MALDNTLVKTTLLLDGKQPEQVLKDLASTADRLEKEITTALNAGDTKKLKQIYKEYQGIEKQTKQIKAATFDMQKVLNNLNGSSMQELRKTATQLRSEIEKLSPETQEFINKSKQLQQVDGRMKTLNATVRSTDTVHRSFFSRAADGFNRYFTFITALVASFAGVVFGIRKAIDAYNQFEDRQANLSSLTGLVGEDLEWLSEQAKQLGISVNDAGIRITKSATDILDAYTLMGSAKPELLKDKEALASVTEQALILAEAAKMETQPAVEGLANTMNAFGAGADQANRYINVLAAGSLEGAATIDQISSSMVKLGPAASSANLTIEETVALIETLADKGVKAEIAGTGLRGVLLRLQTGADQFNPKVVGMKQALDNLAAANLSAGEMVQMFGQENYTAAQILISSKDRFNDLTEAVTGTNVAYEQAIKNTDTNKAKLEQAKNKAALYAIELGEKLAPIMTFSTNVMGKFLKLLSASIDFYRENAKVINSLAIGLAAYVVVVKGATVAKKAYTIAVQVADKITKLFNLTSKATPWGLIAGLIATAAAAIYQFSQKMDIATKKAKMMNDIQAEITKNVNEERLELDRLVEVARDKNKSDAERETAIRKLNELSPKYLGNLNKENILTEEGTRLIDQYIAALERKWKVEVLETKIKEEMAKLVDLENSSLEDNLHWYESLWNNVSRGGNAVLVMEKNLKDATENRTEAIKDQEEIVKMLAEQYKTAQNELDAQDNMATGGNKTVDIDGDNSSSPTNEQVEQAKKNADEIARANEEMRKYIAGLQKDLAETTKDRLWIEYQEQLEFVNKSKASEENKLEAIEALNRKYADIFAELDAEYAANEQALRDQELEEENRLQEELEQRRQEARQRDLDEERRALEEKKRINEELASAVIDGLQWQGQMYDQAKDKELRKLEKKRDAELRLAGDNKDKQAKIEAEFDKEKEALERKYFERQKRLQIAEAFIQGLVEVARINAHPAVTADLTQTLRILLTSLAAARTATSVALIAGQQFYTGNLQDLLVAGPDDGRTYSATYEPFARNTVYSKPTLIGSKLVAERGSELVLNRPTTRNLFMNYPRLVSAIKEAYVPGYASGNFGNMSQQYQQNYSVDNSQVVGLLAALLEEQRKPRRNYVVYDDIREKGDYISEIENSVTP